MEKEIREEQNVENKKSKSVIPIIIIIIILGIIAIFGGIKLGVYFTQNILNNTEKVVEEDECEEQNEDRYYTNPQVHGGSHIEINENRVEFRKPIIYLYPEEDTEIIVKLGKPELLTCTYPKYDENTGWRVIAKPDGTLIEENDKREYYSLYWEGKNATELEMNEGFVVEGEKTVEFLEEKLELLGLTDKEAQEFIIYWLPQMENNKYNLIRFDTMEEINNNMPLEIVPAPDTIIRIMMEWKALDEYMEIPEQELVPSERNGYTVVEWGGSEIE